MTPKTHQIPPISLELPKNSFQNINQKKKISAPQMCKIAQSPSVKKNSQSFVEGTIMTTKEPMMGVFIDEQKNKMGKNPLHSKAVQWASRYQQ